MLTIAPASLQTSGSSYPFGRADASVASWTPYRAFVYKNLPAFDLKANDVLAFDTNSMNDVDVQLEIALAATTVNGGDVPSLPFTTVVTNTQTPANPRGNTVVGDYEMQFRVEQPFTFPGGGLIIRFSNPSASYATDATNNFVMPFTDSSDPSGFFLKGVYRDADGTAPWVTSDPSGIGGFRVINFRETAPVQEVQRCRGEAATITGTAAADVLHGTPRADVIVSLGGNDKVNAASGKDLVCAGGGKDTVKGGRGNDLLDGGDGKDTLLGGKGKDKLKGRKGKDSLVGGPGVDQLIGGPGKDSVQQ